MTDLNKWSAEVLMEFTTTWGFSYASKEGQYVCEIEHWNPLDPTTGQWIMLAKKIHKDNGWVVSITQTDKGEWEVYWSDWTKPHHCYESGDELVGDVVIDDNLGTAFLTTAHTAWERGGNNGLA